MPCVRAELSDQGTGAEDETKIAPAINCKCEVCYHIMGIQNYLWDDLIVGWTCGMLISFDVCCGTDLWDCTMLKGNRF